MTRLFIAFVGVLTLCSVASAQVSRPRPSATPQIDPARGMGVPQPSARPTCGNTNSFFYGDRNGCIYACSDGATTIVAGVTCVFPTSAATIAPTATPTVTATPTLTPTPTVTATP